MVETSSGPEKGLIFKPRITCEGSLYKIGADRQWIVNLPFRELRAIHSPNPEPRQRLFCDQDKVSIKLIADYYLVTDPTTRQQRGGKVAD